MRRSNGSVTCGFATAQSCLPPMRSPKQPPLLLRRRSWHIAISAYEAVASLSQVGTPSPTQREHNGLASTAYMRLPIICAFADSVTARPIGSYRSILHPGWAACGPDTAWVVAAGQLISLRSLTGQLRGGLR